MRQAIRTHANRWCPGSTDLSKFRKQLRAQRGWVLVATVGKGPTSRLRQVRLGASGNGGVGGLSGTGGAADAAGMGGTPDGGTGGVGGALDAGGTGLASQDAFPRLDTARADTLHGGDATGGMLPEAGSNDGLTNVGDALASDARGGSSGDATASDGKVVEPAVSSGSGCKCDTGRSNSRPGNFAGLALLLGALVLCSLRRRRSLGKTLPRLGRRSDQLASTAPSVHALGRGLPR